MPSLVTAVSLAPRASARTTISNEPLRRVANASDDPSGENRGKTLSVAPVLTWCSTGRDGAPDGVAATGRRPVQPRTARPTIVRARSAVAPAAARRPGRQRGGGGGAGAAVGAGDSAPLARVATKR